MSSTGVGNKESKNSSNAFKIDQRLAQENGRFFFFFFFFANKRLREGDLVSKEPEKRLYIIYLLRKSDNVALSQTSETLGNKFKVHASLSG